MDTSEQYIKMCDHPKIRDGWEPKIGDETDKGYVVNICADGDIVINQDGIWYPYKKKDLIWQPSQGQLQDMLLNSKIKNVGAKKEHWFYWQMILFHQLWFNYDEQHYYSQQFNSMEQLWLAFVMYELYNLKWDVEKWQ